MALRFNKLVRHDQSPITVLAEASEFVRTKTAALKTVVFMSHKTGDRQAELEAKRIAARHPVEVYMAEWDEDVVGDTNELPDHIMDAIQKSDGFLVHVIAQIKNSMWIGYEIGGAHAMSKARARIMHSTVAGLPSVVRALERLDTESEVDSWIRRNGMG